MNLHASYGAAMTKRHSAERYNCSNSPLLHVLARAAAPLVPHRLHILARPTTGLSVCLDPGCCGPDEHKLSPFGCVTPGSVDTCPHCSKRLLPLCACRNCGEWLLMGERDKNQYRPPRPGITKTDYLSPALDPAGDKLAADKPKFLTLGPDGKFGAQPSLEFDSQL